VQYIFAEVIMPIYYVTVSCIQILHIGSNVVWTSNTFIAEDDKNSDNRGTCRINILAWCGCGSFIMCSSHP
jgi:hypothetical protein